MSKKSKKKFDPKKALLSSALYAVKATKPKRSKKNTEKSEAESAAAAIEKGRKMARIEAYAKEHNVSITQAMIHFMD